MALSNAKEASKRRGTIRRKRCRGLKKVSWKGKRIRKGKGDALKKRLHRHVQIGRKGSRERTGGNKKKRKGGLNSQVVRKAGREWVILKGAKKRRGRRGLNRGGKTDQKKVTKEGNARSLPEERKNTTENSQ